MTLKNIEKVAIAMEAAASNTQALNTDSGTSHPTEMVKVITRKNPDKFT